MQVEVAGPVVLMFAVAAVHCHGRYRIAHFVPTWAVGANSLNAAAAAHEPMAAL